jgi:hypothetical protein
METKQHKPVPYPSVSNLIMAIAQTINSMRSERSDPLRCYHCNEIRSQDEFHVINKKFEALSPKEFAFMVENLGLSGLNLPPEFFTDESINICWKCFRKVEKEHI